MNTALHSRQLFQSIWQTHRVLKISAQQIYNSTSLHKPVETNEDKKPILYSYWHSSCSWRVRTALNWKNIPYETRAVNILKPESGHHSAEYLAINPTAHVPTLYIDGKNLIESIAILHYLEETRPVPALLPQDAYERAKVREIVEIIASGIQPLQNRKVQKRVEHDKRLEWVQHWINSGFRALEEKLSTSAGKYCVGDEISMADCCLLPQIFNARNSKVDMRQYPIISRIESELEIIPAFIAAHPRNQPDCPTELSGK
uniref:maleylacetoacetate isomerase n=1 Tax=Bactrocera latifrons TaxID=174628 RepID=A0A0K8VI92_BACLA